MRPEPVNILMVDDQPAKLLSYEAILKDLGENLVKAASARDALEYLLKYEFALILVDVCMPEQDGFELVEMIREHHRFRQIPVIFVSAVQLTDLDRIKGYESGAVDYVAVPVVPSILRAKVAVFTELYRKSRDLARLNQDLEQRVAERTAELKATETALMEADRRKDEFLATLAHELRNPLAPMQTSLELLKRLEDQKDLVPMVIDTFERQLSQMTRLIDDLMDVSRITRGKLDLRKESVELTSIAESAVETVSSRIKAMNQVLVVNVPDAPVFLHADAVRLAQVLSNLLHNASRYTPQSGMIHFDVAATETDISFVVRDNGSGIEPADIPKLFEPFYQVNRSLERTSGGLGIGLTLVRTIVEKHNGEISVASEGLGKGSVFTVQIPREPEIRIVASETDSKVESSAEEPVRKILVVDDNRDAAVTLARLLQHLGHTVDTAFDGAQAVATAERISPDLIFMDIGMPEMNGHDAARAIRAQAWGQNIMLIALTGWGQDQDRRDSADAGFDFHLVKPVGFEGLERMLGEYAGWKDKLLQTAP